MADESHPVETALVLSAGAPTAPLIAGVLHAFYEKGVRFPRIYASGAGALVALMLVAPRVKDPRGINSPQGLQDRLAALAALPRVLGVADEIYRYLPLGYKAFFKHGPYTAPFRAWSQNFKFFENPSRPPQSPLDALAGRLDGWLKDKVFARAGAQPSVAPAWMRLYDDWVDLVASLLTPPLLTPGSRGLCAPFPFVEDLVDFTLLEKWRGKIDMPAYDLKAAPRDRLVQFTNRLKKLDKKSGQKSDERQLKGAAEFRACLAGTFIYPPAEIGGRLYTEGAFHDPQNVKGWIDELEELRINNVLILDTLGTWEMEKVLLRAPRGLRDAYGLSIMTGAVAAARAQTRLFKRRLSQLLEERHQAAEAGTRGELKGRGVAATQHRKQPTRLYRTFKWKIPRALQPTLTEWNHSNLSALFEHGRHRGMCYLEEPSTRFAEPSASTSSPTNLTLLRSGEFCAGPEYDADEC